MLNFDLHDEFKGSKVKEAAVKPRHDEADGVLKLPAADFLSSSPTGFFQRGRTSHDGPDSMRRRDTDLRTQDQNGGLRLPISKKTPFADESTMDASTIDLQFTSRIQKGGALLTDMRQLVCHWAAKPPETPPGRYVAEILQKPTRARAEDMYHRAFLPRFIASSPPNVWRLCAEIEEHVPPIEIVRLFYYWLTARAEPILYRYVTEELFQVAKTGSAETRVADLTNWIRIECERCGKKWSDIVTIKTARAMLAALRDFGILEGASKKRISPAHLPLETFCLIGFCLRNIVQERADLTTHKDWRLFLLPPQTVERLLLEAHQHGWIQYQVAGGISRIEFPDQDFHAYCRHIFAR
jgi:hypothetical protein